jgi:hypothetical protein
MRYLIAMRERRKHPRVLVFEVAQVRFASLARTCVVKDVSAGGAALHIPAINGIPDRFTLSRRNARALECEVVWKRRSALGVKFLNDAAPQVSDLEGAP